ncbi:MAG: glutathione-disulfide reductase [Alphaproteobacteria bacterium]|nr:glutathione-disulfide reductase [Alphaproteobacteria bacterium]
MTFDFDLFTIGAGSGGVRASRLAASTGARVAVAEESRAGGTCVVRGCIPKKYMVYASEFGRSIDHLGAYGWRVGPAHYDHRSFLAAMHQEIDRLSGIYARNLRQSGAELFEERAVLEGPNQIRLVKSGRTFSARRILIAAGGRPSWPDGVGGREHVLTSDDMFHLHPLPERLVIFGGGYIGVEFAGIMSGFGVETTLVCRSERVLRGFDEDVRAHVHDELARKGVRVLTGVFADRIERRDDERLAHLTDGRVLVCDQVLMAAGREPYTQGLGLETAGIVLDRHGAVVVDAYSRTNVESVFAVGDVTNRVNLTPVAIREGQAFAWSEFMNRPTVFDHEDIPHAVFAQPPVGVVGLSEEEARRLHGEVDIYKTRFRPMKDMLTGDEERVLMKIVVRQHDDRVLGVHIVGPDAPEIIQAVAIAVKMGASKADFDRTCALHPSIAEELVTMKDKWSPPKAASAV